jgi:Big-like domain-containing protein
LFAVTDSDEVAEQLRFGPGALTPASSAFLSTDLKGRLHDSWIQQVALDGINVTFTVQWQFSTTKTLAQRFQDAVAVGEPVTWTVVDGATTQVITGIWRFSNGAGITIARFNTSGTGFSNDDGIWGAGAVVDGNSNCVGIRWGVGNCNSGDFSHTLWRNGIQTVVPVTLKNFMFIEPDCFAVDAIDDQLAVINDGSRTVLSVLANDKCTGDPPISVVTLPGDLMPDRGGVATTDGKVLSYTPAAGFVGFEEFSYTARDAGLKGGGAPPSVDQDTARVVVNVLEDIAPDAVDDEATTLQSQSISIDVRHNDSLGNEPSAIAIETAPANGTATPQPDGTIRYFPNFNFFGEDSFEYRLTDANGDSDVARVTVGVFFVQGEVPIDIMPNDAGNNLNLRGGQGSGFEVAILSVGEFFDAPALIDPLSLKLGPRQANIWGAPRVRDVDGDGDDDLVVKFLTQQTGITCGSQEANLFGRTFQSLPIFGADGVNTFNCRRVGKRQRR